MGLDWMLYANISKDGCETQYRRITNKLDALEADEKLSEDRAKALRQDLESALEQVSVSAFEVIGAPRVGIDAEATTWFKRQVFEPMQLRVASETQKSAPRDPTNPGWNDRNDSFIAVWSRPFEQVVLDHRGKYVVELAKKREGIATIAGMMCSALDFRGKAVAMSVVITEELRNEAFDEHDADACVDYADRLEASVHEYQTEHPDWQTRQEKNEYGGLASAKDDAGDIEAAVKWLRFWGGNGFGFSGWY